MQNTTSRILYKYWNEVRAGRLAPRRFEIEPARFAAILPETFVIECEEGEGPRFRLAGTRVTEKIGFELRQRRLHEVFAPTEHRDLDGILSAVTERGAVSAITTEMTGVNGRAANFEILVLPLLHTEERVTRLLGAMSSSAQDSWIGTEPLRPGRIVASKIVWPDGRPHAVAERMAPPLASPFKYDLGGSRLVRSRRRIFRVYEGGR